MQQAGVLIIEHIQADPSLRVLFGVYEQGYSLLAWVIN